MTKIFPGDDNPDLVKKRYNFYTINFRDVNGLDLPIKRFGPRYLMPANIYKKNFW